MATPDDSDIRLRLQRLWKGTLFVGVAGGYLGLLAGGLILFGWRAALLALFFVLLGQCLRYIANDIDRLGWSMARAAESADGRFDAATKRDQRRMLRLLGTLALLPSVALTAQAYVLGDWQAASVVAAVLTLVEALYLAIRRANRRTAFTEASYGLRDNSLFGRGPDSVRDLAETRAVRVERRLGELKAMADEGRISQRAYEKARDKHRVDLVMREAT